MLPADVAFRLRGSPARIGASRERDDVARLVRGLKPAASLRRPFGALGSRTPTGETRKTFRDKLCGLRGWAARRDAPPAEGLRRRPIGSVGDAGFLDGVRPACEEVPNESNEEPLSGGQFGFGRNGDGDNERSRASQQHALIPAR